MRYCLPTKCCNMKQIQYTSKRKIQADGKALSAKKIGRMMKYNSSRIRSSLRHLNVRNIVEMVGTGRLNPGVDFGFRSSQSVVKRSHDIESLILGIPLGMIWADEDALGETRLLSEFDLVESIRAFFYDSFTLRNLKILKHLNGLSFSDMSYVERRHLEEMELILCSVSYDSNPLLKCMFVEGLNKDKFSSDAAQLARNIVFREGSEILYGLARDVLNKYYNTIGAPVRDELRILLRLQADLTYCLLLIYLSSYQKYVARALGEESFAFSRSHSLESIEGEGLQLNVNDDLDYALNKLMWMNEINEFNLKNARRKIIKFTADILEKHTVDVTLAARNFRSRKFPDNSRSLTLVELMFMELTGKKTPTYLKHMSNVGQLLEAFNSD